MDELEKNQKFYDIAECLAIFRSYDNKIDIVRELKRMYGPNISLKDLEEQLWAERTRMEKKIKSKL